MADHDPATVELVASVLRTYVGDCDWTQHAGRAVLDALTAAGWRPVAEPESNAPLPVVHKPFPDDGVLYCGWSSDRGVYEGCGEVWPCATVRSREGTTDG